MASWRDSASEQAQDDLDEVLTAALDAAANSLGRRGAFVPFAVARENNGQMLLMAADPAAMSGNPDAIEIRLQVLTQLAVGADALRAAGLVADVTVDGHDAVRVELEHREGATMTVDAPYRRTKNEVAFGELSASAGQRTIWVV